MRWRDSFSDNLKPVLSEVEGSKTCPFDKLRAGSERSRRIENPKWLGLSVIAFVLVVTGVVAQAQQPGKIFRIGFLDASSASGSAVLVDAFRQELSKLGWTEGKNITIEYRFAEQKNERLPELAADLVRLKVDLIVVTAGPPASAAKKATTIYNCINNAT
ncbi:MAG TPA: hypothetical protein VGL70_17235 [Candidatus Binatia bacterium]